MQSWVSAYKKNLQYGAGGTVKFLKVISKIKLINLDQKIQKLIYQNLK